MKTLYVHVGMHKTASTTIQLFCTGNRDLLSSKGIYYPPSPFYYRKKGNAKNGMFLGCIYLDEHGERIPEVEEERMEKGLELINEWFKDYDNVLLSEERLWIDLFRDECRSLKILNEHSKKNGYRVRIIIYLRRQDKFIESWWNQVIKMTSVRTDTFDEYLANFKYLDFCEIMKSYEEVVGLENISVKRFEDAIKGEGILADFMKEIGLELTDEYVIEHEESNSKLEGNIVSIKRVINGIDGITEADNRFLRELFTDPALPSGAEYPCSEFSEEERTELMKKYEEGNAYIAEHFIGDGKPLFSDNYSGKPKRTDDNPEYIKDVIRTSFYTSIMLHREIVDLKAELKQARADTRRIEKQYEKRLASVERRVEHLRHPIRHLLSKIAGLFRK